MGGAKSNRVPMTATKLRRYAGKALVAGETFGASPRDAKVLAVARLATYATRDEARVPRIERRPDASTVASDELAVLRADYEMLAGRKPLGFWKADKLRTEIDRLRADRDASGIADAD